MLRNMDLRGIAGQDLFFDYNIEIQLMIDDRLWDFAQYLLEGDVLLQCDIEVLLQVRLSDLKTGEINGLERLIRRE